LNSGVNHTPNVVENFNFLLAGPGCEECPPGVAAEGVMAHGTGVPVDEEESSTINWFVMTGIVPIRCLSKSYQRILKRAVIVLLQT